MCSISDNIRHERSDLMLASIGLEVLQVLRNYSHIATGIFFVVEDGVLFVSLLATVAHLYILFVVQVVFVEFVQIVGRSSGRRRRRTLGMWRWRWSCDHYFLLMLLLAHDLFKSFWLKFI